MRLKFQLRFNFRKNVLYCNRGETGEFPLRIILGAENPTMLGGWDTHLTILISCCKMEYFDTFEENLSNLLISRV